MTSDGKGVSLSGRGRGGGVSQNSIAKPGPPMSLVNVHGDIILWHDPAKGRIRKKLHGCCTTFPYEIGKSILQKYAVDKNEVGLKALWPWIAFSLVHYISDSQADDDEDQLSPTQYEALLKTITSKAKGLAEVLNVLCTDSLNSISHSLQDRTQHLRELHSIVSRPLQNADGQQSEYSPVAFVPLINLLHELAEASQNAANECDQSKLAVKKGQKKSARDRFISRLTLVWTALSDKSASVHRRGTSEGDYSPFDAFVKELINCDEFKKAAELSIIPFGKLALTSRQIETSLKKQIP